MKKLQPLLKTLSASAASLEDLSEIDGRTPCHFQRIFSSEVGESPLQFSRRVRLQKATAHLLLGDKSILDIALDAGFDSHEGFTRAFKAQFGVTPRKFQSLYKGLPREPQDLETHFETVCQAAPCLNFFRRSMQLTQNSVGEIKMNYQIEKKRIEETTFLYMRRQVKAEEISQALGSMFVPVFQFATGKGATFVGAPTARYVCFGPGLVTIEAGMPIASKVSVEGEILIGSLAGGLVAKTIHKGSYEQLHEAHEAIQIWITDHQLQQSGAPWESYLTDPAEVPSPDDWLTEVTYPLK